MSMKTTDIPMVLGGTKTCTAESDITLAGRFLAELENGARVLRLASPPDQERIDRLVRLTVEVREYIAQTAKAGG